MRVILISAGKGTRLYPLTRNTPKCLLPIGEGTTLIEEQIETLKKCNINDISIITGYLSNQIEAKLANVTDVNLDIIYNPFYGNYNNLHSLWMAKYRMVEDIITINGDDLFTENVIRLLLKREEDIVMTISRKDIYEEDDMKVVTKNDFVTKVGKRVPLEEANGESVGIIKYSAAGARILRNQLEEMVKSEKHNDSFYLHALQAIMDKNIRVNYQEISESEWQEIDFHADYALIQEMIQDKYKKLKRES